MRAYNIIASLLFVMLLCAPAIVRLVSGFDDVSDLERRRLAAAPTPSDFADPASLPTKLNDFLEDAMRLRTPLTRVYFLVREKLDIDASTLAVHGKDGWLFDNLQDSIAMYEGRIPYSTGELAAWVDGARMVKDAACGAPFVVLLIPNKHSIYPDMLPDHIRRSSRPTLLEALSPALERAGIRSVDPTRALKDEAARAQVYFATDTHWTTSGAYIGYAALLDALRAEGVSTRIVSQERLVDGGDVEHAGDLPGLLGQKAAAERIRNWVLRDPAPSSADEMLPHYDWESSKARRVSGVSDAPRLVIYGDSFAEPMMPFLRESFSEITVIHHRLGQPPLSALAGCRQDAVVLAMVERFLANPLEPADQ